MGVLSCNKSGCENIMCDVYVPGVGYICSDCIGDFKKWLNYNQYSVDNEYDLKEYLEEFMWLSKDLRGDYNGEFSIDDFFNECNRNRESE